MSSKPTQCWEHPVIPVQAHVKTMMSQLNWQMVVPGGVAYQDGVMAYASGHVTAFLANLQNNVIQMTKQWRVM
jgi:hypothetical protein